MKNTKIPCYRLRGTLDCKDLTVNLLPGSHLVGSSPQVDVVIPVTGVSRRHARLEVSDGALMVEDLDSTNGTLIDGIAIQQAEVPAGAELCFGPACFVVVEIPSEDAELAIVFDSPAEDVDRESTEVAKLSETRSPERSTKMPDTFEETTASLGPRGAAQASLWLDWVDGFVGAQRTDSRGDLAGALAFLGTTFDLEGCCAARWTEGRTPVVLAAWGTVHEIPPLRELRARAATPHRGYGAALLDTTPPLAASFPITSDGPHSIGLVLWGDYFDRDRSLRLLRTLCGLVISFATQDAPGVPAIGRPATLVFPDGYRPGTSPAMRSLYSQMERLLHGDLSVLVHGETGAGKELVARILHDSSDRRDHPFVPVNCAAIPADLLEAEMFGIHKGVATGVEARTGKFEQADGGTLFLDEIGEMTTPLQSKLLRALQEKEIHPVGGRPLAVDVRVVSATNVDLVRHLDSEALRSDLYYRLAGFVLEVPPLRECPEDLPGLIEHFVRRFSEKAGIHVRGITVAALRTLTAYRWPGNVRELEQEIRRLVYMSTDGDALDSERLSETLRNPTAIPRPGEPLEIEEALRTVAKQLDTLDAPSLEIFERCLVLEALDRTSGNKSAASRLLGISRNGLDKKIKRLEIELEP